MNTHDCAGGCSTRVPAHRLACWECWYRLPLELRDRINHHAGRNMRAHREALTQAARWYTHHRSAA